MPEESFVGARYPRRTTPYGISKQSKDHPCWFLVLILLAPDGVLSDGDIANGGNAPPARRCGDGSYGIVPRESFSSAFCAGNASARSVIPRVWDDRCGVPLTCM